MKEYVVLVNDHRQVLRVLLSTDHCPLILEEIAATASLPFERAWYTVLELIELRFLTPAGSGVYRLTSQGREAANHLIKSS